MLNVNETFASIQGESTFAGLSCFFIRLAGCNLRCRYCDTGYAYERGTKRRVDDVAEEAASSDTAIIEITGGEPLLQDEFAVLAAELNRRCGRPVLVETNGSLDISSIPDGVVAVMDFKCPGSGECEAVAWDNVGRLRSQDEVKFVMGDRTDYEWARDVLEKHRLQDACNAVLFSPVWGKLEPQLLGQWILRDALAVRLQLQVHRLVGMK